MATTVVTFNPLLAAMIKSAQKIQEGNEYPVETEHIINNGNKRRCNKQKGKDSEVFAFKTKEEIAAMTAAFNKHIEFAVGHEQKKIAMRNKLLFLIGINIGIRGSDLCTLKWCDFIEPDGTFKDSYRFQPKKTAKKGKFVRLYYNSVVREGITEYLNEYPIEDLNTYVFFSRKGDEPISRMSIGRIIKNTAAECGIKQNINSHSLRKTWGYHAWHDSDNKEKALVTLQYIFNHASTSTTMKYIGILDDDAREVFENLELK